MLSHNQHQSVQAFGLAMFIEVLIVAGAVLLLAGSTPLHAAYSESVPITLAPDELPIEKPAEPRQQPKPVQKPLQLKMAVKAAPPKAPAPPQQVATAAPTETAALTEVPTAFSEPAQARAMPPAPPISSKPDLNAEYAAKVHQAVQAAYYYPPAAKAMRFSGRVRIEFQLRDGHVGESHVLISCGVGIFDRAAQEAVQAARYPQPPEELRGRDLRYEIWVELSTH